jgi:hypothetical protein
MEKWQHTNHAINIGINPFIVKRGILEGIGSDVGVSIIQK